MILGQEIRVRRGRERQLAFPVPYGSRKERRYATQHVFDSHEARPVPDLRLPSRRKEIPIRRNFQRRYGVLGYSENSAYFDSTVDQKAFETFDAGLGEWRKLFLAALLFQSPCAHSSHLLT
jgi:hypothetical protein